jgi:5'-nucleotidase
MARILISNDDGIDSAGIIALARALARLGEVWVVAPDREQSATSHSISLDRPLRGREVRPGWVAVNGTPTDCVYLGVHHFLPAHPDLVVSGVNHGPNLGDDVHYSGTVAAAMEAALLGLPAAAFSLCGPPPHEFDGAGEIAAEIADRVLAEGLPPGVLLNVNVPGGATRDAPLRITKLGKRRYGNAVERRVDPRGRPYFWVGGDEISTEDREGSDGNAIAAGAVSVTPLRVDITHVEALAALRRWERR